MIRFLIPLITLLLGYGLAQEPYMTAEAVRNVIANDFDAIAIDCPYELDNPTWCYEFEGGIELHRTLVDGLDSRYEDVRFLQPWSREENLYSRMIDVGGSVYGLYILVVEPRLHHAYVAWLEGDE